MRTLSKYTRGQKPPKKKTDRAVLKTQKKKSRMPG